MVMSKITDFGDWVCWLLDPNGGSASLRRTDPPSAGSTTVHTGWVLSVSRTVAQEVCTS